MFTIHYKPRLFIYTTTQIYSTLPKPFQKKYKLITESETNNKEEIFERVRTVVSENYDNRFEKIDWEQLLIDNGMKKPEDLDTDQVTEPIEEISFRDEDNELNYEAQSVVSQTKVSQAIRNSFPYCNIL